MINSYTIRTFFVENVKYAKRTYPSWTPAILPENQAPLHTLSKIGSKHTAEWEHALQVSQLYLDINILKNRFSKLSSAIEGTAILHLVY